MEFVKNVYHIVKAVKMEIPAICVMINLTSNLMIKHANHVMKTALNVVELVNVMHVLPDLL